MDSLDPTDGPDHPVVSGPAARRREGLSLRVALGLMAVVALLMGAWEYRARGIREGIRSIRQHRGMYHYDFEYGDEAFTKSPRSWAPRWLRDLVGVESLHDVTYVRIIDPKFNDDDLARLTRCFPKIKALGIDGTAITDEGLASLRGNRHLRGLFVKSRGVTDAGIDRLDLATLPELSLVDIRGTQVTDAKADEIEAFLKAREDAAKRANPGKRIDSHFVLRGRFGKPLEETYDRDAYDKKLEAEAEAAK